MLYVKFGNDKEAIKKPDIYFKYRFSPKWFEDDLVKKMVLDVDKSEVVSGHLIISPVFGPIAPERLSGGVKGLILLLKDEKFYCDLTIFGNKCCRWIAEIAKLKDIYVSCYTYDVLFKGIDIVGVCKNTNEKFTNGDEWNDIMHRCLWRIEYGR